MRHEPFGVGRIARVAAAEMIIDTARVQGHEQAADRLAELRVAAAEHLVPEEAEDRRVGEFRRAADASVDLVDHAQQPVADLGQVVGNERAARARCRQFREVIRQRRAVLLHRLPARPPGGGDRFQHLPERRTAPARLGRPVGAAVDRPAVRIEEHRHGPAALFAHRVKRRHVDVVDVRPLLAIDLHVDEELVHPVGDVGVLERFVRHHVAPVAGGVADRKQDRAVAALRLRQGFGAPRAPMDGIVGVLQQVGRGRVAEQVAAGVHSRSPQPQGGVAAYANPCRAGSPTRSTTPPRRAQRARPTNAPAPPSA